MRFYHYGMLALCIGAVGCKEQKVTAPAPTELKETFVAPKLVPMPHSIKGSGSDFALVSTTAIGVDDADADAKQVAEYLAQTIKQRIGFKPPIARSGAIVLKIGGKGAPESYTLRSEAVRVEITGADADGLFWGVQTLLRSCCPRNICGDGFACAV